MLRRSMMLLCGNMLLCGIALAQEAGPPEARANAALHDPVQPAEPARSKGFSFLGFTQTRATVSSVVTTNPLLDGQVMGVLGGLNGTSVSAEERSAGVEQRAVGFFTYAPPVLDGKFELGAAFEVDFGWGDQSYGTSGNTGGAFGADQVNLQTRRLYTTWRHKEGGLKLAVVTGLQFVADGVVEPAGARPDHQLRGGGKLIFWGSEAAGVSVYGRYTSQMWEMARWRLGAYTLYEQGLGSPDDVSLLMADGALHPLPGTWVGLHGWLLMDRSGGDAGGLLGTGPTSLLAELQGAAVLGFDKPDGSYAPVEADLLWVGADIGSNADLSRGRLGVTGLVVANLGRLYVEELPDVAVAGGLVDAELRYRYAPGTGSVLRLEAIASTADDEDSGRYTGVITGNSYGIVGAVYATHGTLLLFQDPGAVNRQVAVVYDASNRGDGLVGITGGVGYDLVPNRVTAQLGAGTALTAAMAPMGTELNLRLRTKPWLFGNLDLGVAAVLGTEQPATPWTTQIHFEALAF